MQINRISTDTAAAPSEWVTGMVWIDEIAAPTGPSRLQIDSVHFSPGSRTVWHRHPLGQILHVTAGAGLVQRRGGAVEAIRAGDTVRIEPGEWHWHGAGPTTFITHLAVQEIADDGTEAERGDAVAPDIYPSQRPTD